MQNPIEKQDKAIKIENIACSKIIREIFVGRQV
jgi:hypothetical protein